MADTPHLVLVAPARLRLVEPWREPEVRWPSMSLDADDLAGLYRRYARALLVFFQRRVADPELATDLMADTFTTAMERRAQYRGSTDRELSGWLWAIARSTLREHERHEDSVTRGARRLGAERRALTDEEIERVEDLAANEETRRVVADAMERMPASQAAALRLRVLEHVPYEEIARRQGLTESAARVRVVRALRHLRSLLPDEDGPEP